MISLLLLACQSTTPTPSGTKILDQTLDVKGTSPHFARADAVLGEDDPSRVTITFNIVEQNEALSIASVGAVVISPNGWEVTGGDVGNPVNRGTPEAPVMALPVLIHRKRVSGCSTQTTSHRIELRADRSASVDGKEL